VAGPIRKADVNCYEIPSTYALASDGLATTPSAVFLTTTGVSTTAFTQTVVSMLPSDGEGLLTSADHPVQVGDLLYITGSSPSGAADGRYTVASVVSDTSITVVEPIADSTGGTYSWVWPSGASEIGFDPSNQSVTTAQDLQQALTDIANAELTAAEHAILRQLIHLADGTGGPYDGFTSGAYRVIIGEPFPSSVTWYTDNTMTYKIIEKLITYNSNKTPATVYWAVYATDGITVLATATDTISYSGAFETSRVRTITS